jgi:predicted porin
MQKKIIALAVAGLVSGAAFAQSNVTVYGIVDAYYAHSSADDADSINSINGGGLSGSRIGFKGTEDLGNGLKALFVLEYGLTNDANVGVGEDLARQQLLGLTGNWGTVVAGRAQTAGYDWTCGTSTLAGSALDANDKVSTGYLLKCGGTSRQNNAVAYISPSFSGLTFAVNHARVTEGATATGDDSYGNLLSATYANGPIAASLIYAKVSMESTAADDNITEWGLRGSYDFGMAKVGASYQSNETGNADAHNYQIFGAIPVSAAGTVHLQYASNDIDGNENDTKGWTLAYTHGLSKRTTAYAGYTHTSNDDNAARAAGFAAPSAGGSSSVWAVGLRHSF